MGQAVIQLIQFLCGYFKYKLARQPGQTRGPTPLTSLDLASTIVSVWWVAGTRTKSFHEEESYFGYWKWL